jgi:probable HAF family extracellular repeat protein
MIRKYLATLAWLAALSISAVSQAAPLYDVAPLPDNFHPSDINNLGQMTGALYVPESGTHTGVYKDGVLTDLGTFGGTYSYAVAINDVGDLAGNYGPMGDEHAYFYRNGALQDIGAGTAWGMNIRGDVVGRLSFADTSGLRGKLGFLRGGNISAAYAINDARRVAGESNVTIDGALTHPFLYEKGRMIDLGTLSGQGVTRAAAINNGGQIAGYSDAGDGRMHVFFYDHGAMTDLGGFGGLDVTIGGINLWGQIVGTGNTADGPDVAFISSNGALVELDTLIDPASGWHITSALDINDQGQIVAYACRDALCKAVRLDLASAVPEPGGIALLLTGVLLLATVRPRPLHAIKKAAAPCGYGGFFNLQR